MKSIRILPLLIFGSSILDPIVHAEFDFASECTKKGGRISVISDDIICRCNTNQTAVDPTTENCPKEVASPKLHSTLPEPTCRSEGAWLSPFTYASQCWSKIKEKFEKKPSKPQVSDYIQMLDDLTKDEKNICSLDRETIEKKALQVIGKESSKYGSFSATGSFADDVNRHWGLLSSALLKKGNNDDKSTLETYVAKAKIYNTSWNQNIIPVPVSTDDNSAFRLEYTIKAVLLGVAPVSGFDTNQLKLAEERDEHLLQHSALKSPPSIASHDLFHGKIMENIRSVLNLSGRSYYKENCQNFQKCMKELPDSKNPDMRLALFYSLHESNNLVKHSVIPQKDRNFYDFVLERVTGKKKFSVSQMIGATPEERTKFCSSYVNLIGIGRIGSNRFPNSKKGETIKLKEHLQKIFPSSADVHDRREFASEILDALFQKCEAILPSLNAINPTPQEIEAVSKKLYSHFGDEFKVEYEIQELRMTDAFKKLRNAIAITPSCEKAFGVSDPTYLQEAIDAQDWKKAKQLARKFPVLIQALPHQAMEKLKAEQASGAHP